MKTIWMMFSTSAISLTVFVAIYIGFFLAHEVSNGGLALKYLMAAIITLLAASGIVYMTFKMSR